MKIIDRYVAEVGKKLPLVKGRKDIEDELRSTLEDMLEDRAGKSGKAADDALALELLKEYGAPQKIAETYNPNPYLIGPRMFPFFLMVLKIALAAVALGLTIATGIQIMQQSPMTAMDLMSMIGKWILNVLSAWVAAFGNIALIFALIERFTPIRDFDLGEGEEWNPASLMKEPEPSDVKIWEPILAIVFTFIAISIFNFNPQLIGIYYLDGNEWQVVPILSEAFFRWLPFMNFAWLAEIVLNVMLLRAGRWQLPTRIFSIGIKLFNAGILFMLITGPSILLLTPETLIASGMTDAAAAQTISTLAHQGIRVALGLGIFGRFIEIVKMAVDIVKQQSAA